MKRMRRYGIGNVCILRRRTLKEWMWGRSVAVFNSSAFEFSEMSGSAVTRESHGGPLTGELEGSYMQ